MSHRGLKQPKNGEWPWDDEVTGKDLRGKRSDVGFLGVPAPLGITRRRVHIALALVAAGFLFAASFGAFN